MAASKAQLTAASNIIWVSGALFNGYVLLIAAPPNASGITWSRISLIDSKPKLRIPTRAKIPIRQGVYDSQTQIWQTSSIVPTNVKYAAFWYDDNDRLIGIGNTLFTVTTSPFTLAPPTLTDPTAEVSVPTPETVPSTNVAVAIFNPPTVEDVAGAKNSSNTIFTISHTGSVAMIIWNGVVLENGVGYVQTGTTITMQAGYIPASNDTLQAVIW